MNNKTLSYALIVALVGSVALVGCKKKEEAAAVTPPPAATEPAPMEPAPMPEAPAATVTVTGVTVGTSAAADRSVAAAPSFKPSDAIIVSIRTSGTAENQELAAKLTYQDGQVAGEQKQTINATDAGITNIEFRNATPWPAGKYTVDVTLNGAPAGTSQAIEVK